MPPRHGRRVALAAERGYRAHAFEIQEFTGISAPYQAPLEPELMVDTEQDDLDQCVPGPVNDVERTFALETERVPPPAQAAPSDRPVKHGIWEVLAMIANSNRL